LLEITSPLLGLVLTKISEFTSEAQVNYCIRPPILLESIKKPVSLERTRGIASFSDWE